MIDREASGSNESDKIVTQCIRMLNGGNPYEIQLAATELLQHHLDHPMVPGILNKVLQMEPSIQPNSAIRSLITKALNSPETTERVAEEDPKAGQTDLTPGPAL